MKQIKLHLPSNIKTSDSYSSFVAVCEFEDVAQTVGTTILFRRIQGVSKKFGEWYQKTKKIQTK
jgi:hypothetical protein